MPRIVFLIVDDHPVHKAKSVKRFAESEKDRFRLFWLPPYPPELNPDERGWNDLKNNAIGRQTLTTPQHLKKADQQWYWSHYQRRARKPLPFAASNTIPHGIVKPTGDSCFPRPNSLKIPLQPPAVVEDYVIHILARPKSVGSVPLSHHDSG